MAVQEARATCCSELKESEATYLEAICKNAAVKSLKCTADCSDHTKLMHELERWALDVENSSCQHFLHTHQTALSHAPQSVKEDLHSCYQILLGQSSSSWQCLLLPGYPKQMGNQLQSLPPRKNPNGLHCQKGGIH